MLWKNECNHPIEDYLFTMEDDEQQCDVWYLRHSLGVTKEFFVRYGNQDHEYRSSWDCNLIERSISRRTQYLNNAQSERHLNQLIDLKNKLQELGYWDISWDLTPEVKELI